MQHYGLMLRGQVYRSHDTEAAFSISGIETPYGGLRKAQGAGDVTYAS